MISREESERLQDLRQQHRRHMEHFDAAMSREDYVQARSAAESMRHTYDAILKILPPYAEPL